MSVELSSGEWKLMHQLWRSPMTITQLTAALKDETGWSKHTVITMLSRLEAKGAVTYESGGRAKVYRPLLQEDRAAQAETSTFLQKVYSGKVGALINAMVSSHSLTQADVDELSAILQRAKEEGK